MARLRRSSTILETARQRLAGLQSITPKPNFGPALHLGQYEQNIDALRASLDQYNQTVSLLDQMQNELENDEAKLNDKSKRMLATTGATYGSDSSEDEQVGGTRTSARKRPTSKKLGDKS